ncbi:MAG: TonB-dependent receptor [Opitutaceae bacterium]
MTVRFRAVILLFGFALVPFASAQGVVSAGLTGAIRDESGKPVPDASLTAVHVPTGTTYTAVSTATGRYNFRGLIVGGPYALTASAPGKKPVEISDITTQLGQTADVNISLQTTNIVVMEKFTVGAAADDLDSTAMGSGSVLTRDAFLNQPTAQRSFADMARTNPLVTLRNVFGDRQEGMLTALGQNNRFNSIMLDGARINDQFGLNASGLQSFFNPLSLETAEQVSIDVSPYDVRQSGFTGAAINVVTRSGTNTFHGSIYGYYTDEKHADADVIGPAAGERPPDERKTWGATLGGPLWKDHIFFFANYEKFERIQVAAGPTMTPAAGDLTTITNALSAIQSAAGSSADLGTFGGGGSLVTDEEKKLYKIDWNLTKDHRLSVRYNETLGTFPQFGRFNSLGGNFASFFPGLTATRGTSLSSNFYTQTRTEEVWAATLNNQWSSNLKSEFKWSKTNYEQLTTTPAIFPEVRIFGVAGVGNDGRPVTNATGGPSGALVLGTEINRHGNVLQTQTESFSGNADYFWKNFTFTAGFDREVSEFFNLFRAGSYGAFDYASVADFVADRPAIYVRSMYVQGTSPSEDSDFAITGIFGQAKWDVTPRLNLTAGLRYDMVESDSRPLRNTLFETTFGRRNDGSVDGTEIISPRLGANFALDESRMTQVRGGLGYFTGRAPWVFVSNAFGNTGVGRFANMLPGAAAPQLSAYLRTSFDPANPIGVAATDGTPNARREITFIDDGLKLPAVWRANFAFERKMPFLNSTFTMEAIQTINDKAFFNENLNIRPLVVTPTSGPAVGLDGRQRFNGIATGAGAASTAFGNVIRVRNISEGRSTFVSFGFARPMQNNWSYNLTYTRGKSYEAQAFGQTTPVEGWSRNAVFNQNKIEVERSDFEIRDRIQFSLAKRFEFIKGWRTTASLYYEGHTGNPFSFAYQNDLNGDGINANDLVYVPSGESDPNVDYSGMTDAQRADFLAFIRSSGLGKYAGTYAPRNAFAQPWINQLDLRFTQRLPIYKPAEVELFVDFINFGYWLSRQAFGYVELLTNTNNAVFYRRLMGPAAYNSSGQVRPTSPA